jgi:copper transport protein
VRLTDATWEVRDIALPTPGRWTVRVDVLVSDFEKASVRTSVAVRP